MKQIDRANSERVIFERRRKRAWESKTESELSGEFEGKKEKEKLEKDRTKEGELGSWGKIWLERKPSR